MKMEEVFRALENRYDITELFSIGLFKKFSEVKRTYLNNGDAKGVALFVDILNRVKADLKAVLNDSMYVCLVDYTDLQCSSFSFEKIRELQNLDINIPTNSIFKSIYIEEDEWFGNYFFFESDSKIITSYLWGILAANFVEVEPSTSFEVFFITNDLKQLVNIYDDRGMDIMRLI